MPARSWHRHAAQASLDLRQHADSAAAHAALGRLQGALEHIPNTDMVTRTLARRERS